MAGQAPGRDVEAVEAEAVAAIGRVRPGPMLGGARHTGSLAAADRARSKAERVTVFDLDKRETTAAHGDQVKFAVGCAGTARDDGDSLSASTVPRRAIRLRGRVVHCGAW